jgi:hypothetical protein
LQFSFVVVVEKTCGPPQVFFFSLLASSAHEVYTSQNSGKHELLLTKVNACSAITCSVACGTNLTRAMPKNYVFDRDDFYIREIARSLVAQHGLRPAAALARQRAEQDAGAEEKDYALFWQVMADAIDA